MGFGVGARREKFVGRSRSGFEVVAERNLALGGEVYVRMFVGVGARVWIECSAMPGSWSRCRVFVALGGLMHRGLGDLSLARLFVLKMSAC